MMRGLFFAFGLLFVSCSNPMGPEGPPGPPGAAGSMGAMGTSGGAPDPTKFIVNGTMPQMGSFNVSSTGAVGQLAVGGVIDAPNNLELLQTNDPRLSYSAMGWIGALNAWGKNRFSTDGKYTTCSDEADCSSSWVELKLDKNTYRSVLLSHSDAPTARIISVYMSTDDGASYSFYKSIATQRASPAMPDWSSIRCIVSNLPLGGNLRVRVVAAKGRMSFEGFGLAKMILPETDASPFRMVARASGNQNDGTCDVNTTCFQPLAARTLTFVKTQAETAVRVEYIDNLRVYSGDGVTRACNWYIRFNGNACPSGDVFGSVYSEAGPGRNLHRTRAVGGYCTGLAPGTYTVQVYVGNEPNYAQARCWTGWNLQKWLLEAEEVQ